MSTPRPSPQPDPAVEAVRRFNRFYTRQIGLLDRRYLQSSLSLSEMRVLYELAQRQGLTASDLVKELHLDPGYLSRVLQAFQKRGLISRRASESDARQQRLALTPRGIKEFQPLDRKAQRIVAEMLADISPADRKRLLEAMRTIEDVLGTQSAPSVPYILRPHRPGDMGWVVYRQALLYAQEYGWDERYEALAAEIVGKFIQNFDARRERCWIAERNGESVGAVFLVKHTDEIAKLWLLHVERSARGLGIGARLVDECIRFARQTGNKTLTLWTQSNLDAARHIYKKAGFVLTKEEPHHSFGHDLVAETWDLDLQKPI